MKKPKFLVLLTLIALFFGINTVKATFTVEELGEEMEYVNPSVSYAYVIGDHVFTSDLTFNLQHFMLGARSIVVSGESTMQQLDLLDKMNIVRILWSMDNQGNSVFTAEQYIGTGSNLVNFDIKYIDFISIDDIAKVTITFDDGINTPIVGEVRLGSPITPPSDDPVRAGYAFAGWEDSQGNLFTYGDVVTGEETYTAVWNKIVDLDSIIDLKLADIDGGDVYEVSFDETTGLLIFTVKDNTSGLTVGTGLVKAIRALQATEGVDYINMTYDGTTVKLENGLHGSGYSYVQLYLASILTTVTGKDYADIYQNDIIGLELTMEVVLKDGFVTANDTETNKAKYEIKVDGVQVPTTAEVASQAELIEALNNMLVNTIVIAENFSVTESIDILRNVIIDGNGKTITMDGNTSSWSPNGDNYIFKVYGESNIEVEITDLALTGANAAMIVGDNATVTVEDVDVTGNEFGGIEVKGTLDVVSLIQTDEELEKPTVWVDTASMLSATVTGLNNYYIYTGKGVGKEQIHYHQLTELAVTSQNELKFALTLNFVDNIIIASNFDVTESIDILRNVNIDGSGNKITMQGNTPSWNPNGDNYIFKVYGESNIEVEITDLALTGANAAMIVGDNATVTVDQVDVSGNIFGGIEVVGKLIVNSIIQTDGDTNKPAVWIDTAAIGSAAVVDDNAYLDFFDKTNQHFYNIKTN